MTDKEKLEDFKEYPKELVDKLFFDFDENEMIVIKAHLFIENALDKYITASNKSTTDIEKMNFTFNHKINISKILGLFQNDEALETYVVDLNRLRNQIAHRHSYENDLYDKIVNYPDSFKNQSRWKTKEDFKVGVMAFKSAWIYGLIHAKIDKLKTKNVTPNPSTDKEE